MRDAYAIGEMSRRTGVNIETIRYYERIDLMPEPGRTEGGNRQYNHDQFKRLSFIRKGRDLGFTIEEIRALLEMADREDFQCDEVRHLTEGHLASVQAKIADLLKLEAALGAMIAECRKGDIPRCPIIDALSGDADILPTRPASL